MAQTFSQEGAPRWRSRIHAALDPRGAHAVSWLNRALIATILASVLLAVLQTEPVVTTGRERAFRIAELAFGGLFALEFLVRFWTAAEDGAPGEAWRARVRWLVSAPAIIDFVAIVPAFVLVGGGPSYMLRLLRVLRIVRLAKLGRFSRAWSVLARAIVSRRYELLLSLCGAFVVMLASATSLYLVEGPVQPEKFGSIPRALWWAVVTVTTLGYGDVYPQTALGRGITAMTAILGVGLIAAPTGIMAAAVSDAIQHHRDAELALRKSNEAR